MTHTGISGCRSLVLFVLLLSICLAMGVPANAATHGMVEHPAKTGVLNMPKHDAAHMRVRPHRPSVLETGLGQNGRSWGPETPFRWLDTAKAWLL